MLIDYNKMRDGGKGMGVPDGMTIDASGRLWVANYNGSGLYVFDPHRPDAVAEYVRMPAACTTSLVFAGANYSELYVTSSRAGYTAEQVAADPLGGSTFHVTGLPGNARGLPLDSMF